MVIEYRKRKRLKEKQSPRELGGLRTRITLTSNGLNDPPSNSKKLFWRKLFGKRCIIIS